MKEENLVWKIASGIVLAFLIIGILNSVRERLALQAVQEQLQDVNREAAAQSQRWQAEANRQQDIRREAAVREAEAVTAAHTLPPGYRCIGKDLFRPVENGWVEVTDGSEKMLCR